jgi:ketosteroid isomerase-like protein
MSRIVLLILMFGFSLPGAGQTSQSPAAEVQVAFQQFARAFENLDWEKFRTSFADDATVFFPRGVPARADGRVQYEAKFKVVFEQLKSGKSGPPYHLIRPMDSETQLLGSDVAIITFHLEDRPGMLNRRTIVFCKRPDGWKIVHLHASEVSLPAH